MIESVNVTLPPRLRAGDTVAVVAPAGPVRPARLRPGLELLAERFAVLCDEGVYTATGFLAGDDDRRADELNRALRDPDVRAIMLARGGYGILRILDRLDADALRADPKPIVGFSDATALLAWAYHRAGVAGVHGPVVGQFADLDAADVDWLLRMVTTAAPAGSMPGSLQRIGAASREVIEAPLLGGNLCLLSHLVGTPAELRGDGAVILIEDVGERPYAIDRYLTRLHLAGALDRVRAIVCGDFTKCDETVNDPDPDAWAVIDERLRAFSVPGLRGLPIGHGSSNLAVPFGGSCCVDLAAETFALLTPAVN